MYQGDVLGRHRGVDGDAALFRAPEFIAREERYHAPQGRLSNRFNFAGLVRKLKKLEPEFSVHRGRFPLSGPMAIIIAQEQLIKTLTKVPKDKSKQAVKDMGMEL